MRFDTAIAALKEERAESIERTSKLTSLIEDLEELNGSKPAAGNGTKPHEKNGQKKAAAPRAPAAERKVDPKRAKALEYWKKGKSVTWIAEKLGLQPGGIYYWKKVDQWPEQPEAEDLESEDD